MKRQPTEAQKAQAKARREQFRKIVKQIAALPPEQRATIAAKCPIATCEGHMLSFFNMCLVASQKADATIVGGFRQWREQGRTVRKGEHGLGIWIPLAHGKAEPDASEAESDTDDKPRFMMGTVFDISQTEELGGVAI